jgi:type IV pilus assembly protein PilO
MEGKSLLEKIEKTKLLYRILILVGTLVLLGGLFVWLFVIPVTGQIGKTREEIADLNHKINQAKIKAKNLMQFEAELAQVEAQFQEALKLLPNTREIPSLLRKITELGNDSRLVFRMFSPQRERAADFYVEIPVTIEVSGNYHDVAVFFDKVGRMERIVNILDVTMRPVQERSTTLTTTCNAVTYRFKGSEHAQEGKQDQKKKT